MGKNPYVSTLSVEQLPSGIPILLHVRAELFVAQGITLQENISRPFLFVRYLFQMR